MSNDLVLSPIPLDQLTGLLATIVRQEIRSVNEEDLQEKLLSPKEVCKLFQPNISIATLDNWAKRGILNKHHIGKLTFYKYSEVMASIKSIKKYSRK